MPKPVKKKKKFICKKESTTYRLIPGYVNEDVSAKVTETSEEVETRKEEQRKFGIFYDDSYNYMKHLRSINEQATLVEAFSMKPDFDAQSTSSRQPTFMEHFSTDVREEDDIDPEVLAALDNAALVNIPEDDIGDVAESDDFLDDDFLAAAGGPVPVTHDVEEDNSESDFITDEEDENTDEQENDYSDVSDEISSDTENNSSSFQPTQHRGNMQDDIAEAQTALILKNFEEGLGFRYSSQLSDDEGEMPTAVDYENLKQILKDDTEKPMSWSEFLDDKTDRPTIDASKYLYDDEDEYEWTEAPVRKPKFDCMSILSLHSNTRNLPTDILPPKTELKRNRQRSEGDHENSSVSGLNLKQLQAEMRENRKVDKACTFRPKDETVDERKTRKKAIKDERKERRQEKKANKIVFSMENEKMKKETAALSKSVKSIKIF